MLKTLPNEPDGMSQLCGYQIEYLRKREGNAYGVDRNVRGGSHPRPARHCARQ